MLPCLSGTQKSNPSLQKEVGKNIKDKKRGKRGRDGVPSREGSLKKRGFQTPGNLLTAKSVPSFGSTEGNIKGRKTKQNKKQLKIADCEPYGNSPSGEAAQTPAHAISKWGLGREAQHGLHRLE